MKRKWLDSDKVVLVVVPHEPNFVGIYQKKCQIHDRVWFGYIPVHFAEIWLTLILMLIRCEKKTLKRTAEAVLNNRAKIWKRP